MPESANTLEAIASQIHLSKAPCRQLDREPPRNYRKKWAVEQLKLLRSLIGQYGGDFNLFGKFLPFKTRKQIQIKYQALAKEDFDAYEREERRQRQQRRKAYFDLELGDQLKCDGSFSLRNT